MSKVKTATQAYLENESRVFIPSDDLQKWLKNDLTAHVGNLEGQWLTLIDATFSDPQQRKAMKDIVRKMIWKWDIEILDQMLPQRNNTTAVDPNGRPSF